MPDPLARRRSSPARVATAARLTGETTQLLSNPPATQHVRATKHRAAPTNHDDNWGSNAAASALSSGEMPGSGGPSPAHSQEVCPISSLNCSLTLMKWRPCFTPSWSPSYTRDEARASPRHCLVDAAQAPHAPSRCSMECQARILEALYSSLLLLHITILFLLPILTYKFVITGFLFPFLYLYLAISLMLDCFTLDSSSRCT